MLVAKQLTSRVLHLWNPFQIHTMEVNGYYQMLVYQHFLEYLLLCSAAERNSYRFTTTWGLVNVDRIVISGWAIPIIILFQHVTFINTTKDVDIFELSEEHQRL